MATDRENSLRRAEKLLRQGRLDGAIREYERLVEEQPNDWNTRNLLGDLHVRAGQVEQAAADFTRIADHFAREGFFSRAIALYKKVIKVKPDDEHALLQSAEIAARQGLLIDARARFSTVAEQRRRRGDTAGAADILARVAALDPTDTAAQCEAARAAEACGQHAAAAERYKTIAADLLQRDRTSEAVEALTLASRLAPGDTATRDLLVYTALQRGDIETARQSAASRDHWRAIADDLAARGREQEALDTLFILLEADPSDRATRARLASGLIARGETERAAACLLPATLAGDPQLLLLGAEARLRRWNTEDGRALLDELLTIAPQRRDDVVALASRLVETDANAAFECLDAAADAAASEGAWDAAASALQDFVARVPSHVVALMKLVDVCVDGHLHAQLADAQIALADAHLAAGRAPEARAIAEDLVMRTPSDSAALERLRSALEMLGECDPESVIADCVARAALTGESAFDPEPAGDAQPSGLSAAPIDVAAILGEHQEAPPAVRQADRIDPDLATGGAVRADDDDGVFREFHDEVVREQAANAAAQHYQLATMYRDMGMMEEAVKALESAVRDPRCRFQAACLLGRIRLEQGRAMDAVEWFERAAESPATTVEEGRALLYDLGLALEAGGEGMRALAVYLELQADAGQYRDIGERIDRLSHQ